jgi:hypothetical protein
MAWVQTQCTGTTCDALLECYQDCQGDGADDTRACYCGNVDFTTCFEGFDAGVPQGPCKAEVEALTGTTIPLQIGMYWYEGETHPLGAVNQRILCQDRECPGACTWNL